MGKYFFLFIFFVVVLGGASPAVSGDGMILRTVAEFPYCPVLSDMKKIVDLAAKGDKGGAMEVQLKRCGILDVGRSVELIEAIPDEQNKGITYVKVQYVGQKQDPFWTLANGVDFQ